MRIDDSHAHIHATSRHEVHSKKEGAEKQGVHGDICRRHENASPGHHKKTDPVAISDEARARFESMKQKFSGIAERQFQVPGGLDPKAFLNKLLLGAFAGKAINVTGVSEPDQRAAAQPAGAPAPAVVAADAAQAPVAAGMVVSPDATDAAAQATGTAGTAAAADAATQAPSVAGATATSGFSASVEQLSFSASGTIRTADGEEVGFTLELNLAMASMSGFSGETQPAGQDGLSVNFGGSSAELFSMSFEFNITDGDDVERAGTGNFKVDRPSHEAEEAAERRHHEDDDDGHERAGLPSVVNDLARLMQRASFTSAYMSYTRTTVDSTVSFTDTGAGAGQIAPQGAATAAPPPVDLVA